jgi:polyisoprenoid-binding protein YceI
MMSLPSDAALAPSARFRLRHFPALLLQLAIALVLFASAARAQESVFTLTPAQTKIEFTLDTTLHTVHGTFQLKSGSIHFDPATGAASGSIVVDATSGNSDNSSRDKKMHNDVLETPKFPEITFTPNHVQGTIAAQGTSQINVSGKVGLHGAEHDVTLTFSVQHGAGNQLQAETHFDVPFIDWGLKDPSNLLLHVSKTVNIHITASGDLSPAAK